ncbi:hypothetical protein LTR12_015309 [Friedmanniomyces endolithicus]|nr:hypothetical protein LTR12_015309 [Friedmanniomyces endolithicus]
MNKMGYKFDYVTLVRALRCGSTATTSTPSSSAEPSAFTGAPALSATGKGTGTHKRDCKSVLTLLRPGNTSAASLSISGGESKQ